MGQKHTKFNKLYLMFMWNIAHFDLIEINMQLSVQENNNIIYMLYDKNNGFLLRPWKKKKHNKFSYSNIFWDFFSIIICQ